MIGEDEIFRGKTFSDLLKNIFDNHKRKDQQIKILISDLKPFINNLTDAATLAPILKEYMDSSVKNDELLVKMAQIAQRAIKDNVDKEKTNNSLDILDSELEELAKQMEKLEGKADKKLKELNSDE